MPMPRHESCMCKGDMIWHRTWSGWCWPWRNHASLSLCPLPSAHCPLPTAHTTRGCPACSAHEYPCSQDRGTCLPGRWATDPRWRLSSQTPAQGISLHVHL